MPRLFRIADDELEPVALEPPNPTSFNALDSTGRAMLSVGADDVVLLMAGKVFRVV